MHYKLIPLCLVIAWSSPSFAVMTEECKTSYELAVSAKERADDDEQLKHLSRTVELCPSFGLWMELGDLQDEMSSLEAAAKSYGEAHGLAASDLEAARAQASWADLVFTGYNDPQRAYPKIVTAVQLAPEDENIQRLYRDISARIANTDEGDIKRAWIQRVIPELRPYGGGGGGGPSPSGGAKPPVAIVPPIDTGAIQIPIRFLFNSTIIDDASRPRLEQLVAAMAEQPPATRFRFVGHADMRGDEYPNYLLSERRAQAVAEYVFEKAPQLKGRIDVEGKGELQPLFRNAANEQQHGENRRLEVFRETGSG